MIPPFLTRDPKILAGAPVFDGTEVPFRTLLEYRDAGLPLYEFLLDFPAVRRAQGKLAWAWLVGQDAENIKRVLGVAPKITPPSAPAPPGPGPVPRRRPRQTPWNRS